MTEPLDNTRSERPTSVPSVGDAGVSGGDADRLDSPGAGSGGLPGGGADGETAAREELRKDLGERAPGLGTEDGDDLEQAAAIGETDDPQGGSIQEHGSRP
jgi:hypothetical protein